MRKFFLFIFFLWAGFSYAQDTIPKQKSFSSNVLSFKKSIKLNFFSGYYRFLGFVRNQKRHSPIIVVKQ